jgi:DNA-binding MarR family transcriptional regulator
MRARRLSRVVTSVFDEELRPFGLKASQLNLLATIASMGPVRRTDIGRYLHLDVSTLTRNLRIMETNGWIEEVAADADGRGAPIQLHATGHALITEAAPAWRRAQRRAAALIGNDGKDALLAIGGNQAS